ncbi:DUF4345 domain-containing protein [Thalassovita mangrovi]|uniref:DUF4345 domain-containing protein n=1 Tax=Thalassovita mangrovi TaxID=2692236 RepID=A0A6L8LLZ4_9RHOB|nr:DUF4345 domain-containing protein [Thalassovita mangrovi]MYM57014.1 DUF4345 domain-containing protein [Thalassovita mangrovi]
MTKFIKPFLFLSSTVLLLVGLMLSFAPDVMYASSGHSLPDMTLLRSDLRSGGMVLLVCGLFVLWSALRGSRIELALLISALAFLGYGLGRVVSLGFDGAPDATLATVMAIEWALGLAALVLLWRGKGTGNGTPMAAN